uniref:Succinyl-diaminopimelate desuccinylase n=1 Tax=uncultured Helicobacter sp. TaxID=175537 RepID=A0A650F3G3_9HELI|nr:succinyl-diaminopimelate desuccinylase [uncultured Helicobacter sp.]
MSETISLLSKLITYPSITPQECGIYTLLKDFLSPLNQHYTTHIIEQENQGVKNLFWIALPRHIMIKNQTLHSKNLEGLVHLCFAGHIDVVPAGEGWDNDPFSGQVKEGIIYGRGTQDMKSGVSAFVCAIKDFLLQDSLSSSPMPFALSILLTSDEEGEGTYGTKVMLDQLKTLGILPHFCIVAEPTATEKSGDTLKIGRRGSLNGILRIKGKQGHVAYPEKCLNPVEILGHKLGDLAGINLDNGDENFTPSKLIITDIRGGMEVVNVTPNELKIMFNVRFSPASSEDSIRSYVQEVLGNISYDLELKTSSLPFITSRDSKLITHLSQVISHLYTFTPTLSTSGGTSDARFFAAFGVEVVELGVPNDRIHAINERVSCQDVENLYQIFRNLLQSFYLSNPKE